MRWVLWIILRPHTLFVVGTCNYLIEVEILFVCVCMCTHVHSHLLVLQTQLSTSSGELQSLLGPRGVGQVLLWWGIVEGHVLVHYFFGLVLIEGLLKEEWKCVLGLQVNTVQCGRIPYCPVVFWPPCTGRSQLQPLRGLLTRRK